ncbi:DUF5682 family protein [Chitinophaga vietnamensis]|uniref:DUF5682 family protein n=1 Tax=Chitinophaga vietnamensis TaxID=2593957 RepID=UPI0011773B38|nr:DUF5682 family protein [Chitinophaga vietnamensis]
MSVHILGIRHHGPGSARNVKAFLEELQPDIVLVEGPPEADPLTQWVGHEGLQPPVAILTYQPDQPQRASFYPFATFSPEWQAMLYARQHNIHLRFMDLPLTHVFGIDNERAAALEQLANDNAPTEEAPNVDVPTEMEAEAVQVATQQEDTLTPVKIYHDPMLYLAEAAGYADGEKWWEHMFEYRQQQEQVFDAVHDAMAALRQELPSRESHMEQLREAWMRKMIRQAEKEMFQRIAVICGAWHAPALTAMPKAKDDNELLKGLPKAKVDCTWIPWTYSRLSYESGYGAGIPSPGWYDHNWHYPGDDGTRWMALVAKLFREQQKDTSVAHVMEAVRLANALASLRHYSRPGLEELNEATLSILCNGEPLLMQLIRDELIVSNRIGEVPDTVPKPPLQADIEKLQKKLRMPQTADYKDLQLDLRKDTDLERSIFLHRLALLGVHWGKKLAASGKGTFKEQWRLQWDPSFSVDIIEKGSWGNTVEEAAVKYVSHTAQEATSLPQVCRMLEEAIPAELPAAVDALIHRINNLAAASGDVLQLMEVIPPMVNITRYGNVRKTDADLVMGILESMITRICVSLPAACTALADDAAQALLDLFFSMNEAILLLQHESLSSSWQQTLQAISRNEQSAPVIAGYATRLLLDHKVLGGEMLVNIFSVAMSVVNPPARAAAWLEGFLKGSGTLLLVDEELWQIVDNWVQQLDNDIFVQVLPLLRRTFSNFAPAERRKLGEKVKAGGCQLAAAATAISGIDESRAASGIPVVMQLLGY